MIVRVAENAGFCFGVKKAVDKAFEVSKKYKEIGVPVYTYGQIIHNETVIADLENEGVRIIETPEEIKNLPEKSVIIIRSHGVAKDIYNLINENGHILVEQHTILRPIRQIPFFHINRRQVITTGKSVIAY